MKMEFEVDRTYLFFFLISLLVVGGIGFAVAAVPSPGHSYTQIELPSGAWPGLKAETAASADSVDWSDIQNMPAGFSDGVDQDTPTTCPCGECWKVEQKSDGWATWRQLCTPAGWRKTWYVE